MSQKDDCPVQDVTCLARMATLEEKIKGIIKAVYASAATVTLILTAVEIALRVWKP